MLETIAGVSDAQPVTIPASDGFALSGDLFEPGCRQPRALVIVGGATGVQRNYYVRFARYLAEQGAAALIFDYRGVGGSRPWRLVGFDARMRDWAERDIVGVLDWAAAHSPGLAIRWVGHSFGGFGTGLASNNHLIERQLVVSCASVDWRTIPGIERWKVGLLLGAVAPACAHVAGYFPGWLGYGLSDLPKGVVLEWSRWCFTPHFVFGDETLASLRNFERFRGDLRFVTPRDDPWCAEEAVEHLAGQFPRARERSFRWVEPADVGARRIGHVGFFRETFRPTLWAEAADWLLR